LNGGLNVATLFNGLALANLSGGANITGPLGVYGAVGLFGPARTVGEGAYDAKTDGIVIGVVSPNGTGASQFNATIVGSSAGVTVYATGGGTLKAVNPPGYYGVQTSGTFLLPVRKGQRWAVRMLPPYLQIARPVATYYWIPLGTEPAVRLSAAAARKKPAGKGKKSAGQALPALPFSRRWFSGQGKLVKGRATVRFGAASGVRRLIKGKQAYVVQLTPHGDCKGLAVAAKHPERFDIAELGGGRSSIAFDWTISFPPNDTGGNLPE
jgi:hypothetical protein